jgi:hypothetical protein
MLIIEANYSKKLGLPGYSSHQYSLTLRAEIADVSHMRLLRPAIPSSIPDLRSDWTGDFAHLPRTLKE